MAAARRIGYPVVLKPLDGNHGRGVCLNLMDDESVREAFVIAEDQSRRGYVIVESFVTGRDYRCLIVGGRMQAIAERVPAHVTGDGTHTVRELVEQTNADPRRGVGHEKVLTKIKVDSAAEELLREQGFTLDDVSEVIVARIRLAWTPWPSWTREYWFSRIHGMSRETASSTMAWVDGPNAVRSARVRKRSSSASKSKSSCVWTRSLTSATASRPAARPTSSLV